MNREKIARRIDLVNGTSTGAIVSAATWCALHGQEADAIVAYMAEKMKQKETSDAQRGALIYVLHEVLLTCASRGTSDAAKRCILVAVSRLLPRAVQDTLRMHAAADHTAFLLALKKVLEWWAMMRLFPAVWITQLQKTVNQLQDASISNSAAAPAAILQVADLLQRYQHAKEQWLQNKRIKSEDSSMVAPGTTVDDAARRSLITLRKAVEGRLGGSSRLLEWCEAERAELEGRVGGANGSIAVKAEQTNGEAQMNSSALLGAYPGTARTSVKEEAHNLSGNAADDDDVLASFF